MTNQGMYPVHKANTKASNVMRLILDIISGLTDIFLTMLKFVLNTCFQHTVKYVNI